VLKINFLWGAGSYGLGNVDLYRDQRPKAQL
jgi:hypothetical protein